MFRNKLSNDLSIGFSPLGAVMMTSALYLTAAEGLQMNEEMGKGIFCILQSLVWNIAREQR